MDRSQVVRRDGRWRRGVHWGFQQRRHHLCFLAPKHRAGDWHVNGGGQHEGAAQRTFQIVDLGRAAQAREGRHLEVAPVHLCDGKLLEDLAEEAVHLAVHLCYGHGLPTERPDLSGRAVLHPKADVQDLLAPRGVADAVGSSPHRMALAIVATHPSR